MKIKLAVFFGCKSVEHEISIISAVQAMSAINTEKYDVIPVYVTKNNEMYTGEALFDIDEYKGKLSDLTAKCERVILVNKGDKTYIEKYPQKMFKNNTVDYIDVAFPIVHGTNAEDGSLQGFLQTFNLPYVGCDVMSSAVGMDKYVMKTVLKDNDLPVLDCIVLNASEYELDEETVMKKAENKISYPMIIKPANLGSSIGIKIAKDRDSLAEALELAFEFSRKVLVEPVVNNLKEVNCSVLGDCEEAEASECEEPVSGDEILSFGDKYMSGGSKDGMSGLKRKLPADISAQQREKIRNMAVEAFKCLGCNGVSRIDFLTDSKTGEVWINEINTIPGSLSFYLWEPLGVKYAELLDRMVELAIKRERQQKSLHFSFESNVLSGVSFGGAKGSKGAKI